MAIQAQIEQVQQRVQMERVNKAILDKEAEKASQDSALVIKLIKSSSVLLDPL